MFKNLSALETFGFFFGEVFGDRPRAEEPFVFRRRLFPSSPFLVFQVTLPLTELLLVCLTVFLILIPLVF